MDASPGQSMDAPSPHGRPGLSRLNRAYLLECPVRRPVSSDGGEWWFPGEDGGGVVERENPHGVAGGFACARGVRGEDQPWCVKQCRVDIRFAFEDVECGATDLTIFERLNEGGFIDDSAPRGGEQV